MTAPDGALDETTVERIERFLDDRLVEYDVPGAAVAVLDADGVLYATGLGARTLDPVAPATSDSLFHVASVTKSFTAIAVLQLVERGDLALDDAVREHVAFFADVPGEPIAVEELLTHTSGIPSEAGRLGGRNAGTGDMIRRFDRRAGRRITDRERFMYYNGGYVVLGALVESVAGRPYAEYVEREILAPLGMERSTFEQGDEWAATDEGDPGHDDAMTGYVEADGDLVQTTLDPAEFDAIREGLFGVGGLRSTATDLASLLQCLLNGGALGGERVLEPSTVESMWRPQSPPWPTVEGHSMHYGYGWIVEDLLGETLVQHGGTVPGFHGFVGALPERELAVALGFNRSGLPKGEIGKGILAIACGEAPAEAVRWFRAKRAVDAVAGTYESDRPVTTATVAPAGGDDLSSLETTIEVTVDAWDLQFRAAPDEGASDGRAFSARMGDGRRWTVEFVETGAGTDMLWTRGPQTIRFEKR